MRWLLGPLLLIALLVGVWTAGVSTQGVQCGGSFIPSLNCIISGQWTWTQASPWVIEGATADLNETTVSFADPTADRTVTFPDNTGTVILSKTASVLTAAASGAVVLDGSNPSSVTTGLTTISACSVIQNTSVTPGLDPASFTIQFTPSAGQLDVYAWKFTSASNPTLIASTRTDVDVRWGCWGS